MNNSDPSMNFLSGSDWQQMRLRDAKRTKFREYFKLKQEQDKILQQMSSKLAQQQPVPPASLPTAHPRSRSSTSLQQQKSHLPTTNSNTSTYVVNCIVRALKSRKLAIVDISEIFVVEPEIVEEIDRFRRLKEFQKVDQIRGDRKGEKKKKELMLERLQSSIRNAENIEGRVVCSNGFTSNGPLSKQKRKPRSSVPTSIPYPAPTFTHDPFYTQSQSQPHSNFSQAQFSNSLFLPRSSQDLMQHQLLLRNKPPYKLDQKTIAIVDLIKKKPNLLQKDMIQVLADEYGIKGVTQTSISRYMKRIYEMKKHVEVLVQAQKDGFVVF